MLRKILTSFTLGALAAAPPATAYFGKNKVQYYKYDWAIMASAHVDLYFYAEERPLAERAAALAEESWDDLARRTGFSPRKRVPLVLYSSHAEFEETNILPYLLPESVAGFTELFKNRVVVPFDGSYARLRRVLRHELTHYFMYELLRDVYSRHQRYDYGAPPFWFVEGLAEYYAGDEDTFSESILADALYAGELVPLTAGSKLTGTYLGYKEGESALRYLAATYGEDKITDILDAAWLSRDFTDVLDLALPKKFEAFDEEWRRWVRTRYWPRYAARTEFQALGPALSKGFGLRSGVAWLDANRFVYLSDEDGYASLYLVAVDDNGDVRSRETLVQGERSPSFAAVHVYLERPGTWGGNLVAFVARVGPRDRLYVYDVARRRAVHRYAFHEDLVTLGAPSFAPDGGNLVFRGVTRDGRADIYVADLATGDARPLTQDLADDAYPCWTADGIIFSSERDAAAAKDHYNLYRADPATGEILRLTNGPWQDLYAAGDDGGAIYFISDRRGVCDVYRLGAAGEATPYSSCLTGILEAAPRPGGRAGDFALIGVAGQNYEMRLAPLAPVASEPPAAPELPAAPAPPAGFPPAASPQTYAVKGYRPQYGLDYFTAQVAYGPEFGTQTGVVLSLTDQLNNRNVIVQVGNDAQSLDEFLARTSVGVDYYDLHRRVGYGVGAFHYVSDYFDYSSGIAGLNYSETRAGVGGSVSYPLDRFHRVGANLYGYELERRWEIPTKRPHYGTKVAPYLSATRDTSLWFYDGPLDGARATATLGVTEDVRRRRTDYVYVLADGRQYFRTTRTQCFAARMVLAGTTGPDARPLYAGGSLSMRGYKYFDFHGRRFAMLNVEYRFPVLEPFPVRTAVGAVTTPAVRGALFFDVGRAWDDSWRKALRSPRGSFGLGVRAVLGSVLTLRMDHAVLTDFKSLGPLVPIRFFVGWSY